MLELWLKLAENISFSGSTSEILTEDELFTFEREYKVVLPEDYKEFCQTFGSGVVRDWFLRIYAPSLYLIREQEVLSLMINQIENSPSQNRELDQRKIDLLNNAFTFGNDLGSFIILWDLRTLREADKSYDIYCVFTDDLAEESIQIGRSFFELIQDYCYGSKASESNRLLHGNPALDLKRTFHRINPNK